jgi:hypothetical protein
VCFWGGAHPRAPTSSLIRRPAGYSIGAFDSCADLGLTMSREAGMASDAGSDFVETPITVFSMNQAPPPSPTPRPFGPNSTNPFSPLRKPPKVTVTYPYLSAVTAVMLTGGSNPPICVRAVTLLHSHGRRTFIRANEEEAAIDCHGTACGAAADERQRDGID